MCVCGNGRVPPFLKGTVASIIPSNVKFLDLSGRAGKLSEHLRGPLPAHLNRAAGLQGPMISLVRRLSAPKSQRFLRFAIAMPIADPRNRVISETRESNAALRFKAAMESR